MLDNFLFKLTIQGKRQKYLEKKTPNLVSNSIVLFLCGHIEVQHLTKRKDSHQSRPVRALLPWSIEMTS